MPGYGFSGNPNAHIDPRFIPPQVGGYTPSRRLSTGRRLSWAEAQNEQREQSLARQRHLVELAKLRAEREQIERDRQHKEWDEWAATHGRPHPRDRRASTSSSTPATPAWGTPPPLLARPEGMTYPTPPAATPAAPTPSPAPSPSPTRAPTAPAPAAPTPAPAPKPEPVAPAPAKPEPVVPAPTPVATSPAPTPPSATYDTSKARPLVDVYGAIDPEGLQADDALRKHAEFLEREAIREAERARLAKKEPEPFEDRRYDDVEEIRNRYQAETEARKAAQEEELRRMTEGPFGTRSLVMDMPASVSPTPVKFSDEQQRARATQEQYYGLGGEPVVQSHPTRIADAIKDLISGVSSQGLSYFNVPDWEAKEAEANRQKYIEFLAREAERARQSDERAAWLERVRNMAIPPVQRDLASGGSIGAPSQFTPSNQFQPAPNFASWLYQR